MWPGATDVTCNMCVCVCVLGTSVGSGKMAVSVKMPLGGTLVWLKELCSWLGSSFLWQGHLLRAL